MNLSRKIVIARLVISLLAFAYLGYAVYVRYYEKGIYYDFTVLISFFSLFLLWSFISQTRFHRIAAHVTEREVDERTYFYLQLVYFFVIFMALIDFATLDVSRIRSIEPYGFYGGMALFIVACLVRWWAYSSIGTYFSPRIKLYVGHQLVTSGAYKRIRHPLYLGMLLELVAIALMFGSIGAGLLIVILAIPAVIYRINLEEAMFDEAFPEAYGEYSRHSKKLIPFVF